MGPSGLGDEYLVTFQRSDCKSGKQNSRDENSLFATHGGVFIGFTGNEGDFSVEDRCQVYFGFEHSFRHLLSGFIQSIDVHVVGAGNEVADQNPVQLSSRLGVRTNCTFCCLELVWIARVGEEDSSSKAGSSLVEG